MRKFFVVAIMMISQVGYANGRKPNKEFEAQTRLIMLNNDTLYGTTWIDTKYKWNDFKGSNIHNDFMFKENGKQTSKSIRPKNVKGFLIKTADSAWASFISSAQVSFDSDETGYLSGKYFLLQIIDGDMSVYHTCQVYGGTSPGQAAPSDKTIEVVKILYIKSTSRLYHSMIYESWQSRLLTFVKACPELVKELKAVKCGWSFLQIADYYNSKCKM